MKPIIGAVASLAAALALSACGDKEGANGTAPSGDPVAAVAAPAGTSWADKVAATPEGGFVMGNPDAAIKVIEFASYSCSHCRDFSETSASEVRELVNSGKMSFEIRNFVRDPLDMSVALLARCGGAEPFFPLTEQFFGNQNTMFEKAQGMGDAAYQAAMSSPPQERFVKLADAVGLIEFAKQHGIAEDQAKQCLADAAAAEKLAKGVEEATRTFSITGTPAFVVNGTLLENVTTWEALKAKLKEAGI